MIKGSRLALAALALLAPHFAFAQGAVVQSGIVVPQNLAMFSRNGVIADSGINSISLNFPVIASGHLIGNCTGSPTAATDTSLSCLIDTLGTPTQGSILYRDSNTNGWKLLAPGTSGQLLTTLGAGANPVWTTVAPTTYTGTGGVNVSGSVISLVSPVAVSLGGTGITAGTSGGIPYFSASNQMASSATLTGHSVVLGGDVAAAPYTIANGNSGFVLTSNGPGADPSWNAAATGTVTSVATGAGLTGGTITTTGTVACTLAAASTNGCVTPDANAAHFLAGDGTWSTPAGTTPAPKSATSASFNPGSTAAGACNNQTTTVTGATTAMAVAVSPAGGTTPGAGFEWHAYVSAANTVIMNLCNFTSGALTPTATTYNIRVIP